MFSRYDMPFAVAVVKGHLKRTGMADKVPVSLMEKAVDALTEEECAFFMKLGEAEGIKLYRFKIGDRALPRVQKVMGFLKGIQFENLLDVGSGRGVFLLPFLRAFPTVKVTALDVLPKRVEMLSDLSLGGVKSLTVKGADICHRPFPEKSFDVVTMLEVLEHIPHVENAIASAIAIARRFVVVTVPSKEDDNSEHIHLLTKEKLTEYFRRYGVSKLSFDGVPGHLFMIASLEK